VPAILRRIENVIIRPGERRGGAQKETS